MKNRNKLIAGVGGVALIAGIAGMGTFALWSDTDTADAGVVTAGLLDVEQMETSWDDISGDLPRTSIEDINTWRVVPGDTLEMVTTIDLALDGDNLAANLNVDDLENALVEANVQNYVTLNVALTDAEDNAIVEENGVYRFSADENNGGQELGGVKVGDTLDGTADVTATVTLDFSETTPEQALQNLPLADFSEAGVTLTQVRDGDGFITEEETP